LELERKLVWGAVRYVILQALFMAPKNFHVAPFAECVTVFPATKLVNKLNNFDCLLPVFALTVVFLTRFKVTAEVT
jgi:hypothetical protein